MGLYLYLVFGPTLYDRRSISLDITSYLTTLACEDCLIFNGGNYNSYKQLPYQRVSLNFCSPLLFSSELFQPYFSGVSPYFLVVGIGPHLIHPSLVNHPFSSGQHISRKDLGRSGAHSEGADFADGGGISSPEVTRTSWVFPKIGGKPPQIIHFNRVFHYFHHPF